MQKYFTGIIIFYALFLLYMMFFGLGREASEFRDLQSNPLQTIRHFLGSNIKFHDFMVNIIGNIFAFSPFGWLGILFKKLFKIGPLTVLFTATICIVEFLQYSTGRGTADIDDVFLNSVGMLIGYVSIKIIVAINAFNFRTYFLEEEFQPVVAN